jgi:hypothetical protein
MYCDKKKFQYSGKRKFDVQLAEVSASVYGTTITFNFPSDKSE